MCVILSRVVSYKPLHLFESGLENYPGNSFIREFFTEKLSPFAGRQAPLRVLNNVLEISWRTFVYRHMHYANSASEFTLPLIANELIADQNTAAEFSLFFLRRIAKSRLSTGKHHPMQELHAMYIAQIATITDATS